MCINRQQLNTCVYFNTCIVLSVTEIIHHGYILHVLGELIGSLNDGMWADLLDFPCAFDCKAKAVK